MGYWAYSVQVYDTNGNSGSGQAQNENEAIRMAENSLRHMSTFSGQIAPGRTTVRHIDPDTGREIETYTY